METLQLAQLPLTQSRKSFGITKCQVITVEVPYDFLLYRGIDMREHRSRGYPENHLAGKCDLDLGGVLAVLDPR